MSIDYGKTKAPARDRILHLLSNLGWHSWKELHAVGGVRYSARILELKRLGYEITSIDNNGQGEGRQYKLASTVPGKPKGKKVKIFLEEEDTIRLINFLEIVQAFTLSADPNPAPPRSHRTLATIKEGLASFQANREKL